MREGRHYIQSEEGKAIQIHREGGEGNIYNVREGRQYIQCEGGKALYTM